MFRISAILVLAALIPISGLASAQERETSCVVFVDDVAAFGEEAQFQYFNFAYRKMTQQQRFGRKKDEPKRDLDISEADALIHIRFLETFCAENPDKEFPDAVMALYHSLPVAE